MATSPARSWTIRHLTIDRSHDASASDPALLPASTAGTGAIAPPPPVSRPTGKSQSRTKKLRGLPRSPRSNLQPRFDHLAVSFLPAGDGWERRLESGDNQRLELTSGSSTSDRKRRRTAPVSAAPEGKYSYYNGLWTVWCGREDSNFHGLSATTTSTLRVYQFRHDRTPSRIPAGRDAGRRVPLAKRMDGRNGQCDCALRRQ